MLLLLSAAATDAAAANVTPEIKVFCNGWIDTTNHQFSELVEVELITVPDSVIVPVLLSNGCLCSS